MLTGVVTRRTALLLAAASRRLATMILFYFSGTGSSPEHISTSSTTRSSLPEHEDASRITTVADTPMDLTHNMSYVFKSTTKAVGIPHPAYRVDIACTGTHRYTLGYFDPSPPLSTDTGSVGASEASQSLQMPDASLMMVYATARSTMFCFTVTACQSPPLLLQLRQHTHPLL
ncbi:hypothetical protein F5X98DRAFT_344888 [Xylaria grammica]|nr:hypothetical protein F5X98DRAFT_344888 [Xylaria grammica]